MYFSLYLVWVLLSFLNMQFCVFHQIWAIFSHHFSEYYFSFMLSLFGTPMIQILGLPLLPHRSWPIFRGCGSMDHLSFRDSVVLSCAVLSQRSLFVPQALDSLRSVLFVVETSCPIIWLSQKEGSLMPAAAKMFPMLSCLF